MTAVLIITPFVFAGIAWMAGRAFHQARSRGYAEAIHDLAEVTDVREIDLIGEIMTSKQRQLEEVNSRPGGKLIALHSNTH